MIVTLVVVQLILLIYHQVTTWFDFFPFNGARNYTVKEKCLEAGSNCILMSLAPIGYIFKIADLVIYGAYYYWILFAIEVLTWWVPYFFKPSKKWAEVHERLHGETIMFLPHRGNNPAPNLEHTILHGWTLVTALLTTYCYLKVTLPTG